MRINKSKSVRMLFLLSLIIAFSFIMTFSFLGCRPDIVPVEETIDDTEEVTEEIEEIEETTEEAVEETVEEAEEDNDLANTEIIGNINILSGLELSDDVLNNRPIAVMIENSNAARPQSGLINADIVFEVVDEYGITRYVAIFSSNDAEIMGPVRSARIYYAEIARSFDPIYAFWGTYDDAYPVLKKMDMDALDANSGAHFPYTDAGWREPERHTAIEHTAFIDIQGIREDAEANGYALDGGQSPMRFKLDAIESKRGSIADIIVDFSHKDFKVGFTYDIESNSYLKSLAGAPHIDFESGQQLVLNNIIVLITDIDGPIDQAGHMAVRTTGTSEIGKAYYFMDGNVVEGTWSRSSIFDSFEFKDLDGNPVLFNRGSTWISMIPGMDRLMY